MIMTAVDDASTSATIVAENCFKQSALRVKYYQAAVRGSLVECPTAKGDVEIEEQPGRKSSATTGWRDAVVVGERANVGTEQQWPRR